MNQLSYTELSWPKSAEIYIKRESKFPQARIVPWRTKVTDRRFLFNHMTRNELAIGTGS